MSAARMAAALVALFLCHSASYSAGYWAYTFPYDGTTATGTWATVRAFSEAKVTAYYAGQGISAGCYWTTGEPLPQVSTTGRWGGTYTSSSGSTLPCTGGFAVAWTGDPTPVDAASCNQLPGRKWNDTQQVCAAVKEEIRTNKPLGQCSEGVGNPIFPTVGSKRESVDTLLRLNGLPLRLTYDSSRQSVAAALVDAPAFGQLWFSSFHRRVEDRGTSQHAYRGDGRVVSFPGSADLNDRLIPLVAGGFRLIDAAAQAEEDYDASGKLIRLAYIDGRNFSFTYSDSSTPSAVAPASGYLIQVSDAFGRAIRFEYTLPTNANPAVGGRVSKIIDAAGQAIGVTYDATGNLQKLAWADGTAKQFVYELISLPWALTGVIDEQAKRFSSFGYDAQGNALSTKHAGDVARHVVSFASPPQVVVNESYDSSTRMYHRYHDWTPPVGTVVTYPNGTTVSLQTSSVLGLPRITNRSQPAGSGCAASSSAVTYDASGNASMVDDFNQHRTCYAHDGKNRETVRVEGLSNTALCGTYTPEDTSLPTGTRKTRTQWHPDWHLAVKVAEPLRLTTYVYNGRPDPLSGGATAWCAPSSAVLPDGKPIAVLCKRVEQATLDANGSQGFAAALDSAVASRTWSYTYNQYGQLLTEKDPLNNVTTYTYYSDTTADHRLGDLQSVQPPLVAATRYTKYNAAGLVLQAVDANGVATDYVYDTRQRLLSATTAGAKTSYDWYPTGLLKKVTAPDLSFVTFGYDDAHRLTSITDNLNNSITYTLDASGNRKAESVKDPGSVLKRQVSRIFDALNRVQQSTGRQ